MKIGIINKSDIIEKRSAHKSLSQGDQHCSICFELISNNSPGVWINISLKNVPDRILHGCLKPICKLCAIEIHSAVGQW